MSTPQNRATTLIRNATVVPSSDRSRVYRGDLLVVGDSIHAMGPRLEIPDGAEVVEAQGRFLIPGFVQAHIHLCQVLFRGLADDLALLDWLEKRIWPMEAAHTAASLAASARLGVLELTSLGTTSILDMGTVRHTQSLLEAVETTGLRYWGGKCFMDDKETSGPLWEATDTSLRETQDLLKTWAHRSPLINYALSPRFVISCTDEILAESHRLAEDRGLLFHTHASENKDEIAWVQRRTGRQNIEHLAALEALSPRSVIVHGIHWDDAELGHMLRTGANLVHCPSSNLKLASGVAPVEHYRKRGLKIAIGADGAPCNNTLDPFLEMRLTALLQKPVYGPEAMNAAQAFDLATRGGAEVLGAGSEIGTLEVGKKADLVLVDRFHPSVATVEDPYSALVYSCSGRDVDSVMINGKWIVRKRQHQSLDSDAVIARAKEELAALKKRASV